MARFGSDSEKLQARQEQFLTAMLTASSVGAAAQAAKVSERTAYRWLALPQVRERFHQMRCEALDQALTQLQSVTNAAVITLVKLLKSDSDGVKLRAATAILEYALRAREQDDLAMRLEALEARAGQAQQRRGRHIA